MYTQKINDQTLCLLNSIHKSGEFNGKPYDNFELHCAYLTDKANDPKSPCFKLLKVKANVFPTLGISNGDVFIPFYDNFGNIIACKKLCD